MTRTLARGRKWKPGKCSFVEHLMGAMKSIASHLPEKYGEDARNVPSRGSDLASSEDDDDGSFIDPIENAASGAPNPEEELAAKQALDRIERMFADDDETFGVLVLLAQGKSEPEIAQELSLPSKTVHAAIARIRYKMAKVAR